MAHLLSVDNHPQCQSPRLHGQAGLETTDLSVHSTPAALTSHQGLQGQPLPETHLDRIFATFTAEPLKDLSLEKGRIHAEFQGKSATETSSQLPDKRPHEALGPSAVVRVAGAVTQPEDLSGLGETCQHRIIARIFTPVRVKATQGPGNLATGADHRAVYIDRQSAQAEPLNLLVKQLAVQANYGLEGLLSELLEPVDHGTLCGNPGQPAQPGHKRIVRDAAQVLQPAGTHNKKSDDQKEQAPTSIVSTEPVSIERLADSRLRSMSRM